MKTLALVLISISPFTLLAQWEPDPYTSGDIYFTGGKIGIGTSTGISRKLTVNGGIDLYGEGSGDVGLLLFRPVESGSGSTRWFLRADLTNNGSYPYLTNRAPNGKVVIKTGSANGGSENTHFTIDGGDGTVNAYFENANLGIGTSSPNGGFEMHGLNQRLILSTPTVNQVNSGRIEFWEGLNNIQNAEEAHFAIQYDGGSNSLKFKGKKDASNPDFDYLTIQRNGNVGIGNTTPSSLLEVKSTSSGKNPTIESENDQNVSSYFYTGRSGHSARANKTVIENAGGISYY